MNHLIKRIFDKVVLALALVAAALSAGWFWRQQTFIRSLQREPIRPVLTGPAYVAAAIPLPQISRAPWLKPPAQSRGRDWLYDIFTPPAITYHAATRTFAVTPPRSPAKPGAAEAGLQLLTVKREPYRLQLVGYFGEPGDYVAAFASQLSSETLLARPGHRFETLGLTLKSFDVRKVAVEGGEFGPGYDVMAVAVLQDEMAGAEVVLDSQTRKLTDTFLAVFTPSDGTGESHELHEGETFAGDDAVYRVERIRLDPPEVCLIRTSSSLPGAEMRVLHPVEQLARQETLSKSLVPKATTDVATANP